MTLRNRVVREARRRAMHDVDDTLSPGAAITYGRKALCLQGFITMVRGQAIVAVSDLRIDGRPRSREVER
jgi:hypothetical protein